MNWDFCRTFIAVAETGSYVAAARQLRSSHPTVARQIAALEAGLGTRLFARTNEGLALTAQGASFKRHADAMAAAALSAEGAAAARGIAARGSVKLSIGPTLAAHWLMPHVGEFLQRHPQIEPSITPRQPMHLNAVRAQFSLTFLLSDLIAKDE